jgi:hypothetical protein
MVVNWWSEEVTVLKATDKYITQKLKNEERVK